MESLEPKPVREIDLSEMHPSDRADFLYHMLENLPVSPLSHSLMFKPSPDRLDPTTELKEYPAVEIPSQNTYYLIRLENGIVETHIRKVIIFENPTEQHEVIKHSGYDTDLVRIFGGTKILGRGLPVLLQGFDQFCTGKSSYDLLRKGDFFQFLRGEDYVPSCGEITLFNGNILHTNGNSLKFGDDSLYSSMRKLPEHHVGLYVSPRKEPKSENLKFFDGLEKRASDLRQ